MTADPRAYGPESPRRYPKKMSENAQLPPKQLHFGLLLLISFTLFNLGYIVNQTLRWSEHFHGITNGIFHVFMLGVAWCFYILPWSLIVFAVYRWRKWKQFRAHWILTPAVLALLVTIGSLIVHPPTPSNRFKSFAKTHLPENIQNLHVYFSGGGIADYHDEYYFETSPGEVRRLISEMNLTEDGGYLNAGEIEGSYLSRKSTFPSPEAWRDSKVFARNNRETGWHYELRVDSTETKVFITIGCI